MRKNVSWDWCSHCSAINSLTQLPSGKYRCSRCKTVSLPTDINRARCYSCGEENFSLHKKRDKVSCKCLHCGQRYEPGYRRHIMDSLTTPFAKCVFKARRLHNYSKAQLARLLGQHQKYIDDVESGRTRVIPRTLWHLLCRMSKCSKFPLEMERWERAAILTEFHNLTTRIFDDDTLMAIGWLMQVGTEKRLLSSDVWDELMHITVFAKTTLDLIYLDNPEEVDYPRGASCRLPIHTPLSSFFAQELTQEDVYQIGARVSVQHKVDPHSARSMIRNVINREQRTIPYDWCNTISKGSASELQARLLVSKRFDPFIFRDYPNRVRIQGVFQRLIKIARIESYTEEEAWPAENWKQVIRLLST